MDAFLTWLSRTLSLLFAAFLGIFALDVFEGAFEPLMIVGFLVHLLPSFFLIAVTFVAWRRPLVGAIGFIGFAFLYIGLVGLGRPWGWYLSISAPALIVGILYSMSWYRKQLSVKNTL